MAKKIGSTGRFGSRYGKKLRTKVQNVEKLQRKKQKCPYCQRLAAKRVAMGIWCCDKCKNKFTGNAYYLEE